MNKYIVFTLRNDDWTQETVPLESLDAAMKVAKGFKHYLICEIIKEQ